MLQSLRRRFRSGGPEGVATGDVTPQVLAERLGSLRTPRPVTVPPPRAEFVGYALDCEIHALVSLDDVQTVRWSDLLSACTEIQLREALLVGLEDGEPREVGDLVVARNELVAAWASPFRGSAERRVRTRAERVTFASGPYRVVGFLHALPTADAFVTFEKRASMVPLSEATIEVPGPTGAPGARRVVRGGTLIVNRALIRDLRLWHNDVEFPAVTARFAERLPVNEMTGVA